MGVSYYCYYYYHYYYSKGICYVLSSLLGHWRLTDESDLVSALGSSCLGAGDRNINKSLHSVGQSFLDFSSKLPDGKGK